MDQEKTAAFRLLRDDERKLLETLLNHHRFDGRDELRGQLEWTTARLMGYKDNYGSIELRVSNGPPYRERKRVPVEGQYLDEDGIPVWLLLHINREGFMCELEIVRADGKPLIAAPTPERLEVY